MIQYQMIIFHLFAELSIDTGFEKHLNVSEHSLYKKLM